MGAQHLQETSEAFLVRVVSEQQGESDDHDHHHDQVYVEEEEGQQQQQPQQDQVTIDHDMVLQPSTFGQSTDTSHSEELLASFCRKGDLLQLPGTPTLRCFESYGQEEVPPTHHCAHFRHSSKRKSFDEDEQQHLVYRVLTRSPAWSQDSGEDHAHLHNDAAIHIPIDWTMSDDSCKPLKRRRLDSSCPTHILWDRRDNYF